MESTDQEDESRLLTRLLLALALYAHASAATVLELYGPYRGYWLEVDATAYSIYDENGDHIANGKSGIWVHKTADGRTDTRDVVHGVAVSQTDRGGLWLPVGSKIVIPWGLGYLDRMRANDRVFPVDDVGPFKVKSRGGVRRVDVRFNDHADAVRWAGPTGHRTIRIFVISH